MRRQLRDHPNREPGNTCADPKSRGGFADRFLLPAMDTADHLRRVDSLLAHLSAEPSLEGPGRGTGQGFAVTDLGAEPGQAGPAEAVLTAALRALIEALRARWGDPRNLVMGGFVDPTLNEDRGLPLVTPLDGRLVEMCGWAVRDRWVGCGIVRSDGESELRLVAVVAERADPPLLSLPADGGRDWANATWLERLAKVTGWDVPVVRSIDWPSVEAKLGTALPTDYRHLAERFGSGEFDEFLWLSTPDSSATHHDLVEEATSLGELAAADADIRGLYHPYQVFPAPGGLLRWADSVQADQFFWLTDGTDPNHWPIIACSEDYDRWERFDGSTTEFIYRVLKDPGHPFSVARYFDSHVFAPFEGD